MGALLFLIITASCILFFVCTRQLKQNANPVQSETEPQWVENYYDNIELNLNQKNNQFYEVYERIDEPRDEYIRYTEPGSYTYGQGDNGANDDDDYIRMVRDGNKFNELPSGMLRGRNDRRRDAEPSYLEVIGK